MPRSLGRAVAWAAALQGLALLTASAVLLDPGHTGLAGACSPERVDRPWWCNQTDMLDAARRAESGGSGVAASLGGGLALFAVNGARLQAAALASAPADWVALGFLVALANSATAVAGLRAVRAIRRTRRARAAVGAVAAQLRALAPIVVRLLPIAAAGAALTLVGGGGAAAAAPAAALPLAARQWGWSALWGLVALLHEPLGAQVATGMLQMLLMHAMLAAPAARAAACGGSAAVAATGARCGAVPADVLVDHLLFVVVAPALLTWLRHQQPQQPQQREEGAPTAQQQPAGGSEQFASLCNDPLAVRSSGSADYSSDTSGQVTHDYQLSTPMITDQRLAGMIAGFDSSARGSSEKDNSLSQAAAMGAGGRTPLSSDSNKSGDSSNSGCRKQLAPAAGSSSGAAAAKPAADREDSGRAGGTRSEGDRLLIARVTVDAAADTSQAGGSDQQGQPQQQQGQQQQGQPQQQQGQPQQQQGQPQQQQGQQQLHGQGQPSESQPHRQRRASGQQPPIAIDLADVFAALQRGAAEAGDPQAPASPFLYESPVHHLTVSLKVPLDDLEIPQRPPRRAAGASQPAAGPRGPPPLSDLMRSALLRKLQLPQGAAAAAIVSPIVALPGCTQVVAVLSIPAGAGPPRAEDVLRTLLEGPLGDLLRARGGAREAGAGRSAREVQVVAQIGDDVATATATAAASSGALAGPLDSSSGIGSAHTAGGALIDAEWSFSSERISAAQAALQSSCWLDPLALLLPERHRGGPAGDEAAPPLRVTLRGIPSAARLSAGAGGDEGVPPLPPPRMVAAQGNRVLVDTERQRHNGGGGSDASSGGSGWEYDGAEGAVRLSLPSGAIEPGVLWVHLLVPGASDRVLASLPLLAFAPHEAAAHGELLGLAARSQSAAAERAQQPQAQPQPQQHAAAPAGAAPQPPQPGALRAAPSAGGVFSRRGLPAGGGPSSSVAGAHASGAGFSEGDAMGFFTPARRLPPIREASFNASLRSGVDSSGANASSASTATAGGGGGGGGSVSRAGSAALSLSASQPFAGASGGHSASGGGVASLLSGSHAELAPGGLPVIEASPETPRGQVPAQRAFQPPPADTPPRSPPLLAPAGRPQPRSGGGAGGGGSGGAGPRIGEGNPLQKLSADLAAALYGSAFQLPAAAAGWASHDGRPAAAVRAYVQPAAEAVAGWLAGRCRLFETAAALLGRLLRRSEAAGGAGGGSGEQAAAATVTATQLRSVAAAARRPAQAVLPASSARGPRAAPRGLLFEGGSQAPMAASPSPAGAQQASGPAVVAAPGASRQLFAPSAAPVAATPAASAGPPLSAAHRQRVQWHVVVSGAEGAAPSAGEAHPMLLGASASGFAAFSHASNALYSGAMLSGAALPFGGAGPAPGASASGFALMSSGGFALGDAAGSHMRRRRSSVANVIELLSGPHGGATAGANTVGGIVDSSGEGAAAAAAGAHSPDAGGFGGFLSGAHAAAGAAAAGRAAAPGRSACVATAGGGAAPLGATQPRAPARRPPPLLLLPVEVPCSDDSSDTDASGSLHGSGSRFAAVVRHSRSGPAFVPFASDGGRIASGAEGQGTPQRPPPPSASAAGPSAPQRASQDLGETFDSSAGGRYTPAGGQRESSDECDSNGGSVHARAQGSWGMGLARSAPAAAAAARAAAGLQQCGLGAAAAGPSSAGASPWRTPDESTSASRGSSPTGANASQAPGPRRSGVRDL
ncbi:hypothetical protein Rsub_04223 [Raphidocelis subcapitata]|uniref:Uncharacterized protein n=1 Tax=Raphidocelis subcapitata TaxID=307507 RepID=A0A2V0P0W0_9CHLO|nr:hypothetical protein Rsub_04223 [Raphidocelis subcapitata]|eukprot:GBF91483.1 hypothetical protein Rsub_04223 [Raphidocelis subcapitata]